MKKLLIFVSSICAACGSDSTDGSGGATGSGGGTASGGASSGGGSGGTSSGGTQSVDAANCSGDYCPSTIPTSGSPCPSDPCAYGNGNGGGAAVQLLCNYECTPGGSVTVARCYPGQSWNVGPDCPDAG